MLSGAHNLRKNLRKIVMTPEHKAAIEVSIASLGSKATYTGAGTSILGWLMSSEFGILVGVVVGVAGFAVNWYYKHKQHVREQEEHNRRIGLYE